MVVKLWDDVSFLRKVFLSVGAALVVFAGSAVHAKGCIALAARPKALLQLGLRGLLARVFTLHLLTVARAADEACKLPVAHATFFTNTYWLLVD